MFPSPFTTHGLPLESTAIREAPPDIACQDDPVHRYMLLFVAVAQTSPFFPTAMSFAWMPEMEDQFCAKRKWQERKEQRIMTARRNRLHGIGFILLYFK